MLPPGLFKGRSVHITLDNSDGKQQTLTGAHPTGTMKDQNQHTHISLIKRNLIMDSS